MPHNPYSNREEEKQEQKTLEDSNGEELDEEERSEEDQNGEEEEDLFEEWLDEVEERFNRIEEKFGDRRDVELIKDKGIRPFYYFKDERGDGEALEEEITDKQTKYLGDLADKQPQRFWKFSNNEEDIEAVGPPEEVISKLTKRQASRMIDFLTKTLSYKEYKEANDD